MDVEREKEVVIIIIKETQLRDNKWLNNSHLFVFNIIHFCVCQGSPFHYSYLKVKAHDNKHILGR